MLSDIKSTAKALVRQTAIRGGLEMFALADRIGLGRAHCGRGAIFTLHHVRPRQDLSFQPNAHLEITPDFLDTAIRTLKARGYDFIALQDVPQRLLQTGDQKPFAVFTLDDGYRNNLIHAAPVFTRHNVPFTVFIAGGLLERTHSLWWETGAALLNRVSSLDFDFGQGVQSHAVGNGGAKLTFFNRFAAFLDSHDELQAVARLDALARTHGLEPLELADQLLMNESELLQLIANPLASLGAHSISHRNLARLSDADCRAELVQSKARVEAITHQPVGTFAYPYGFKSAVSERTLALAGDAGFSVAVTTQPNVLRSTDSNNLTALPRLSLNGHFQRSRYVRALASGLPFFTKNRRAG